MIGQFSLVVERRSKKSQLSVYLGIKRVRAIGALAWLSRGASGVAPDRFERVR
jgi:hypothetical protein